MSVERVSRMLAYVTCFYTFSLFATAMGIAAVNVAGLTHPSNCISGSCYTVAGRAIAPGPSIAMVQLKAVPAGAGCKVEIAEAPEAQKL